MQAVKEASRMTSNNTGDGSQWAAQLKELRADLGVSKAFQPFDSLERVIVGLRVTPRVKGILNWVVATKLKEAQLGVADRPGKVSRAFVLGCIDKTFIDVSQNPCRKAYTPRHGTNHTMTTVTQLVHLGAMRVVLPAEQFYFQGHNPGRVQFPDVSNKTLRELAGEGMFLGSLGTLVWALHLLGAFNVEDHGDAR